MLAVVFLVTAWSGTLLPQTDETTDAQFFPLDAPPPDLAPLYRETLDDLHAYTGALILK